jgi:Fe-S-cluster containining protein
MVDGSGDEQDLAAGDFSSWIVEMQGAIRGEREADVPCAGCTACCTSSQFVHIAPDETDTLAHIPAELLFPAPRLPAGHVLLGYDERGHCPMLVDNQCSIYEHRPRACRTYDCRIFPAGGLSEDDDDKVLIARRAGRWRFSFPTDADRMEHDAVQAAARFLDEHRGLFPESAVPTSATQLAVLAIEIHDLFLGRDEPDADVVRADVMRLVRRQSGGTGPSF